MQFHQEHKFLYLYLTGKAPSVLPKIFAEGRIIFAETIGYLLTKQTNTKKEKKRSPKQKHFDLNIIPYKN